MATQILEQGNVLVLLSGGIDSAACVDFYQSQGSDVSALYVDYGQAAELKERPSAEAVAHHFDIPLQILICHGAHSKEGGEIQGRNAFFAFTGLMEWGKTSGLIVTGIHAGTEYGDCSPRFVELVNSLFEVYSMGQVCFAAPFLEWHKADVWEYSKQRRVPEDLTYSCEIGLTQPCGRCVSCHDLEILNACR